MKCLNSSPVFVISRNEESPRRSLVPRDDKRWVHNDIVLQLEVSIMTMSFFKKAEVKDQNNYLGRKFQENYVRTTVQIIMIDTLIPYVKEKTGVKKDILSGLIDTIRELSNDTLNSIQNPDFKIFDSSALLDYLGQVQAAIEKTIREIEAQQSKGELKMSEGSLKNLKKLLPQLDQLKMNLRQAVDVNIYKVIIPKSELKENIKLESFKYEGKLTAAGKMLSGVLHAVPGSSNKSKAKSKAKLKEAARVGYACKQDFPSEWIVARVERGLIEKILDANTNPECKKIDPENATVYYIVDCRAPGELYEGGTHYFDNPFNTHGHVIAFKNLADANAFADSQDGSKYDIDLGWRKFHSWTQKEREAPAEALKSMLSESVDRDAATVIVDYTISRTTPGKGS